MKKIILLVTFPLLFMFACSSNSMRINTFKQKEFIVDETKKVSMHVNERVTLEESEDVIIKSMATCDIDANGEYFYIADPSSSQITKYDIQNGQIQKFYKAGINLTDSLAMEVRVPVVGCPTVYAKNCYIRYYETIQEGKELVTSRGYDSSLYGRNFRRPISSARLYNDYIYALAYVNIGFHNTDTSELVQGISNMSIFIKLNKDLELLNVYVPDCDRQDTLKFDFAKRFPLARDFRIVNDKVYMNAQNEINRELNIYDSLTSVLKLNIDFVEEEIIDFLPDEYNKSKQGYKLDFNSYFTEVNNQPYVAYPYGTKIKNLETGKEFELKNLPYTNKAGFDYLTKRANDFSLVSEQTLSASNRVNLLPIRIWDIFRHKDNLVVLLAVVKELAIDDYEYDFYLQEYTTDGELVKYAELDEITKYGALEKIAYDNYHRQFLLFRKNSQNWIVEKAKW